MTEYSQHRPPRRALLCEQLRAGAEAVAFVAALPALSVGPRGDGHGVLVLPGLMADDHTTVALRHVLRVRGYRPHAWRLGTNIGPTQHIHDGLVRRLAELSAGGEQPVSIIGWSLGGILARELARRHPESVRSVITLGSPFRLSNRDDPDATHAGRLFHAFLPWHTDFLGQAQGEEHRRPLQVPATSIYSRLDGVVPWQACLDLPGPLRENIEVSASHLGLGVHPVVLAIVLDRLRQPVGAWQPFNAAPVAA